MLAFYLRLIIIDYKESIVPRNYKTKYCIDLNPENYPLKKLLLLIP